MNLFQLKIHLRRYSKRLETTLQGITLKVFDWSFADILYIKINYMFKMSFCKTSMTNTDTRDFKRHPSCSTYLSESVHMFLNDSGQRQQSRQVETTPDSCECVGGGWRSLLLINEPRDVWITAWNLVEDK